MGSATRGAQDVELLRSRVEAALAPTTIGFGGRLYCGVAVLGSSDDDRHDYLWASCQEFYRAGSAVSVGSGVSIPVRVGRAAGTVTVPGDGTAYEVDVRRLFPQSLQAQILDDNAVHVDQDEAALRARAERDLATT